MLDWLVAVSGSSTETAQYVIDRVYAMNDRWVVGPKEIAEYVTEFARALRDGKKVQDSV